MTYKVVPVDVAVLKEQGSQGVARRVEAIINETAAQGWQFLGLENVEIIVTDPGSKGCFGIGARPQTSQVLRSDMAIFQK